MLLSLSLPLLFLLCDRGTVAEAKPTATSNTIQLNPVNGVHIAPRRLTSKETSPENSIYLTNFSTAITHQTTSYWGFIFVNGEGPRNVIFDTGSSDVVTNLTSKNCDTSADAEQKLTYGSQTVIAVPCSGNTVAVGLSEKQSYSNMQIGYMKSVDAAEGSVSAQLCGLAFPALAHLTNPVMASEFGQFTFYLGPLNSNENYITIGGYDPAGCPPSGCQWDTYPVVQQPPPSNCPRCISQYSYWGVDVTAINAGGTPISPSPTFSIIDSGTTYITMNPSFYSSVMQGLGVADNCQLNNRVYSCKASAVPLLKPLSLTLGGGGAYVLTPEQYLAPGSYSYTTLRNGTTVYNVITYSVQMSENPSIANNMGFILGQTFIRAFRPINFDYINKEISINRAIGTNGTPAVFKPVGYSTAEIIGITAGVFGALGLLACGGWFLFRNCEGCWAKCLRKGEEVPQQDPDSPVDV